MNGDTERARIRRVLVALDAASSGAAAVESAARLAALLGAELHGLFVEDIDLLRLAALPFAQEVAFSSAAERRIEVSAVEALFRVKVEERRQSLAVAAQGAGARWSFHVVRGRIIDAAAEADLLFLGRREALPAIGAPRPVVVLVSGSPSDRDSLQLAAQMSGGNGGGIVVLVMPGERGTMDLAREECERFSAQFGAGTIRCEVAPPQVAVIADAVRRCRGKLLLINPQDGRLARSQIADLVERVDCPVVLVQGLRQPPSLTDLAS
jgi:nucleotide-binding universal stress UspA family protein